MLKSVKIKSLFLFIALMGTIALSAQQKNVTDAELTTFAKAYQDLQVQNQKAQEEMVKIVQAEGMDVERFSAIQKASMDPNVKADATDAEMKMHDNAMAKIKKIQPELEKEATEKITAAGMTMESFEALAAVIQKDQSLQQRLQTILMNSKG